MISISESGNSKSTKEQEKLGLIIISAQHMGYRTGDSFKGRNKEQETRRSDWKSDRRLSECKLLGRTRDKSKGRNKEQETRCRKGIMSRRRSTIHESRWDRRQVQGKE